MSDEEIKELFDKVCKEKADEPKDKPKNDMWVPLFLSMLAFSSGGQQPNIALEKEVSYLHGKVDALENIMADKK